MKQFGLIGFPLSHSFSKQFFTEKFAAAKKQDHHYDLFPLATISELPALLSTHPNLMGLNVTIPYKQRVIPYLTDSSLLPAELNACNCIKIIGEHLIGYNTDWIGFLQTLQPLLQPQHKAALVLGNGGAAQAVKYALKQMAIPFTVVGRTNAPGIGLTYDQLDEACLLNHAIIINTTPLGTFPAVNEMPSLPYQFIGAGHLLYDLVYNPPLTPFLAEGIKRGAIITNGYEMLALQAEAAWDFWNS